MRITIQQARRFILNYQGLLPPHGFRGKQGVLEFIHRVRTIQFDPIDIVGRNPELVLQSRVDGYRPAMLEELLYTDRLLVDGYDKQMSIYPVEDWPYFRRQRERTHQSQRVQAVTGNGVLDTIREVIKSRGPVSSLDFEKGEKVDWSWAPTSAARAALESMYLWGELVIHHKVNSRRYYDFSHRLLPEQLLLAPDPIRSKEQYEEWHVLRRIGAVGLLWNRAGEVWLGTGSISSKERALTVQRLLDQGKIIKVEVDGIADPFYIRSQDLPLMEQSLEMDEPEPKAAVLAPLDNLLWDRRMLKCLFDFDYRWEVYVPAEKRRYGYYVLPLLYGTQFAARFEPVRDKKRGALLIKNWWWEPEIQLSRSLTDEVAVSIRKFAEYLGYEQVITPAEGSERTDLGWLDKV